MEKGKAVTTVAVVAGVAFVIVYFVALRELWLDIDLDEVAWARRSALLGGLEALAFAGAGALLGTTVQRAQVGDAKKDAERARETAQDNAADARSAVAMRSAITAKQSAVPERFAGAAVDTGQVQSELGEILAIGEAAKSDVSG